MSIKLSIVIVNWNTEDLITKCLGKVYQYCLGISFEVMVIDNNSSDNSIRKIEKEYPKVILIKNSQNIGPVAANNQGIKQTEGEFIMLLNSDAFLTEINFSDIFAYFDNNKTVGIIGPQFINEDGSLQNNRYSFMTVPYFLKCRYEFIRQWFSFPMDSYKGEKKLQPRCVDWVSTACMILRAEMVKTIGMFDENYFIFYDDVDYCKKALKSGWLTTLYPEMEVIHLEGKTISGDKAALSKVKNINRLRREINSMNHYFKKNFGLTSWIMFKIGDITASLLRIIISLIKICLFQNITYRLWLIKYEIYRAVLHLRYL